MNCVHLAASSIIANNAKRLLFTSLAPALYDYVGDPSLMQSLNHFLACYFTRIRPIELERDLEIDGPPCLHSPEGARADSVLKCESMSLVPPFKNESAQCSCLPTILKTLQDYQNVVSFLLHYAKVDEDCLEAISYSDEESHRLTFSFNQVASDSRIISLKLFQLAQKQQHNLLRFPFFEIQLSLSCFKDHDYFFHEFCYRQENNRSQWHGGKWRGGDWLSTDSLLHQIYLHRISDEELMYNWVKQHMNNVRENLADQINDHFTEMETHRLMIPTRYQALDNLYQDVFDVDNSAFCDSIRTGELAVWIDYGEWTKYQERYPLLRTVLLADYEWVKDEDDPMINEEEEDDNTDEAEEDESDRW